MQQVKLAGYGYGLPDNMLQFQARTRYRVARAEEYFTLVETAVDRALCQAQVTIADIDCIVAGMATPLQMIPCNGALIHERIAKGLGIPAFDINSTCTSFITALDLLSCLIAGGKYKRVLLVSGDIASQALNPEEPESYELFSDVCTAFVLEQTDEDRGVLYAKQRTWSKGAHQTEIPRGGALSSAFCLTAENRSEYYFTMDGVALIRFTLGKFLPFLKECLAEFGHDMASFDFVVPHQASRALPLFMEKVGVRQERYIDLVEDYGNMVSGAVPFALCKSLETGKIKPGDQVLLVGTAAGLTLNFLALKY